MGCLYCGGPIPGKTPHTRGRAKWMYCSVRCGDAYHHLTSRRKGLPIEHCALCGHVILRGRCPKCGARPGHVTGGWPLLILAIFRQAVEDGALGEMVNNGVAAELIGADPGYIKRLYTKGETR